jgi:hypothetical protein
LSNTKLTSDDQEELAGLELAHAQEVAVQFGQMVQQKMGEFGLESARAFDYAHRATKAEQLADVKLPDPDQIVPTMYSQLLYSIENNLIEANAIAREARRRADKLTGLLEALALRWLAMTIETTQWKAEAAGAAALQRLRLEVNEAKAHAKFCESAHDTVKSKLFALNWMMLNWDRIHHQVNRPTGGNENGNRYSEEEL